MAYDEAPLTPVQERTQTPDLTAASGQPGGGGSVRGILELIQGLGGGAAAGGMIPSEAILGAMQGPSFGQRMGAAASGGVAFMRGQPNPAVAMLEEQRRQQQGIAQMLERMNEQARLGMQWKVTNDRLDRAENRLEASAKFNEADKVAQRAKEKLTLQDKVYENFIQSATDPETKALLAKQRAGIQEQLVGAPVPENVIEGWTRPTPQSKERNDQIIQGFVTAANDSEQQALVAKNFNLDPTAAQYYMAQAKNPEVHGFPSAEVLRGRQVERELKEKDLLEKDTPRELKGDQKYAMSLLAMGQKLYPEREYVSLSAPERAKIADGVHLQQQLEEEKKLRLQRDLSLQNALALIGARGEQKKPTPWPQIQKGMQPYEKGDELLTNLNQLKEQLKGIPDSALPSGDDWFSQRKAQLQRNTFYAGNQNLTAFAQLWNPVMIGSLDRGYFDEKGPRSQQVFQKQLDVVDRLPSRKTMNYLMDTLTDLVQNKLLKDLDTAQKIPGYPPEVIDGAKALLAPYVPKASQVQPNAGNNIIPALKQKKQFMDMRPQSKNYGKPVWAEFDVGDPIPQGYIEVK